MKIHWTDLELEEFWSLTDVERQELFPGKTQSHRLAIAALLKFYQIAGCFPGNLREIPERAILHLARTLDIDVSVSPSSLHALPARTSERHRAEIRRFLGIRQAGVADQKRARQWLIDCVITGEQTTVELLDHVEAWFHKALTPLIYPHITPYGVFDLDMRRRLPSGSPKRWRHEQCRKYTSCTPPRHTRKET